MAFNINIFWYQSAIFCNLSSFKQLYPPFLIIMQLKDDE
jgi:hypothetical protein